MDNLFNEQDIPVGELRKLGLLNNGKPRLSEADMDALLAGHRTDLITLQDINADGIHIKKMDAKLSLERMPDGHITLQLHPIYRDIKKHPLLLDAEAQLLEQGKLTHVQKTYQENDGKRKSYVIEYDPETREFIAADPDKIRVPAMINGEKLSDLQKEQYRNGSVVELSDGTRLQRRASSRSGVTSNREALMYSLVLDGGISYLLLRSLRNLFGSKSRQKDPYTEGYQRALQDMQQRERNKPVILQNYAADPGYDLDKEKQRDQGNSRSR
ncbi:DUF4099 domain-containing protein [Sphingobacterium deserti]|uniref:DUF4099 domain-containing protein n=1 Tax=Sphingobacterium deserti TaxID=1229276 RepID=A0A0B8SZ56_9SPHI|nr:DUF4099 domain-containing protein [Sphingobacterium deserti]KGE12631.1 hypothetical protein DI53_3671 [Sphingobacterium deserti]